MYFEIDMHVSMVVASNNTTVTLAIFKNTDVVSTSVMPIFCKTAGDYFNGSITSVVKLATGDKIQLVVRTDNGADVTFRNIATTIRPFLT